MKIVSRHSQVAIGKLDIVTSGECSIVRLGGREQNEIILLQYYYGYTYGKPSFY
jgi:hypothetical protein